VTFANYYSVIVVVLALLVIGYSWAKWAR